jgi:hypothetical protein
MSNRIQDRSLALYIRVNSLTQQLEEHHLHVKTLTEQFEELLQLQHRVRSAEAKVINVSRYRKQRKGYGSSPRSGGRVH